MKLSQRGEYGLRALMFLGMNHGPEVVRIKDIAEQQNIPRRFLEHILNDLKSAGLVKSRRGAAGGYRLQGEPKEITMIEIIFCCNTTYGYKFQKICFFSIKMNFQKRIIDLYCLEKQLIPL